MIRALTDIKILEMILGIMEILGIKEISMVVTNMIFKVEMMMVAYLILEVEIMEMMEVAFLILEVEMMVEIMEMMVVTFLILEVEMMEMALI